MTDYYVTAIEKCATCSGRGFVYNRRWQLLFEELGEKATGEQEREWWLRKFGCAPESEEIPCGECEGEGTLVTQVTIEIAVARFLKRIDSSEMHP